LPSIIDIEWDKGRAVGTTKLTRKEILAEDAVHGSIISLVDFFGEHKKKIVILGIIVILAALGVYGGLVFLEKKEIQAQEILGRGIDFYHAKIDPDATEDPYEKGSDAVFRSESLKYQAAAGEFSSIVSEYGYTGVSPIARYYLGLTELKQEKTEEAVRNLEEVANSSKGRKIGNLAKKVLAQHYEASGNYEEAKKLLKSMIDDPSCDLPKDDLSIQLSRILVTEGKDTEAIEVLEEANSRGSEFSSFRQKLLAELDRVQKKMQTEQQP
jgi:TolA-binding protein